MLLEPGEQGWTEVETDTGIIIYDVYDLFP